MGDGHADCNHHVHDDDWVARDHCYRRLRQCNDHHHHRLRLSRNLLGQLQLRHRRLQWQLLRPQCRDKADCRLLRECRHAHLSNRQSVLRSCFATLHGHCAQWQLPLRRHYRAGERQQQLAPWSRAWLHLRHRHRLSQRNHCFQDRAHLGKRDHICRNFD